MKNFKNKIYCVLLLIYLVLLYFLIRSFFESTKKCILIFTFLTVILLVIYFVICHCKKSSSQYFLNKLYFICIFSILFVSFFIKGFVLPQIGFNLCLNSETLFQKSCKGKVLGSRRLGSIFDPQVLKINNKYYMYVSTRENNSISLSKSDDGIEWSNPTIVFSPSNDSWDSVVNRANILFVNGIYYMYYTGQSGNQSSIGLAVSKDGEQFERVFDNPILVPNVEFENNNVMNPYVLYDDDKKVFRMYYAAGEMYEPDVIAYAESEDGINFIKKKDNPIVQKGFSGKYDSYKVGGCEVHKLSTNKYIMFYIGYTDINTARILYAVSEDGITFKTRDNNLVLEPTKFYFDSSAVYKPTVVFEDNIIKLWYNGRKGDSESIGYATCKECNL